MILESSGKARPSCSNYLPKFALLEINERGIPLTMSRIYACKTPGSRSYDEDFAHQVETQGSSEYVNELLEEYEEQLLEQTKNGEKLSDALAYLKSRRMSPLRDRPEVSTTRTKIDIQRTEYRATIVAGSHELGARVVKEIADGSTSEESGDETEVGFKPGDYQEEIIEGQAEEVSG